MMKRNAAAASVTPAASADHALVIPAASADPDSISDSGSSTSAPPPKPGRKQTNSVLQVARAAGAPPAIPNLGVEGKQLALAIEESSRVINDYLYTNGRIPMTRSEEVPDDVDLNALLAAAPGPSRRPAARQVDRPVICAYCNCAFCFGPYEVLSLDPGLGCVYPPPPVPITLNLLTPPAVAPLNRVDPWGPNGSPELLLVCSNEQHFKVTMGMLLQPGGGAPSLVWKCPLSCLRVVPIIVGSQGANSSDLHANPAPPPEPWAYAGAYWNYVKPGDEDMVKLKLHDDPLMLTLGRR